jgi:hypothetical protein
MVIPHFGEAIEPIDRLVARSRAANHLHAIRRSGTSHRSLAT